MRPDRHILRSSLHSSRRKDGKTPRLREGDAFRSLQTGGALLLTPPPLERLPRAPEMTEVEPVLDFASSGRSGRRNALPDILGSPAGVNPGDLPLKLAELNLQGEPEGQQKVV